MRLGVLAVLPAFFLCLAESAADICNRPSWIRRALVLERNSSCDKITDVDLAKVKRLSIFLDAHELQGCRLANNCDTGAAFKGLTSLRELKIHADQFLYQDPLQQFDLAFGDSSKTLESVELEGVSVRFYGVAPNLKDLKMDRFADSPFKYEDKAGIKPNFPNLKNLRLILVLDHNYESSFWSFFDGLSLDSLSIEHLKKGTLYPYSGNLYIEINASIKLLYISAPAGTSLDAEFRNDANIEEVVLGNVNHVRFLVTNNHIKKLKFHGLDILTFSDMPNLEYLDMNLGGPYSMLHFMNFPRLQFVRISNGDNVKSKNFSPKAMVAGASALPTVNFCKPSFDQSVWDEFDELAKHGMVLSFGCQ